MDRDLIHVLLVDDDEDDYVLVRDLLTEVAGKRFELERVATYDAALEELRQARRDIYLIDYRLGERDGLELLRAAIDIGCKAPIIILTGQGDHDVDVAAMEAGAADYLVKDHLSGELLERSIRYALERKRAEKKLDALISKLQAALARVKHLSGLLPICASCKKIRDDQGYWQQVESYISKRSEAEFSHGFCPDCLRRLYPEYCDEENGEDSPEDG